MIIEIVHIFFGNIPVGDNIGNIIKITQMRKGSLVVFGMVQKNITVFDLVQKISEERKLGSIHDRITLFQVCTIYSEKQLVKIQFCKTLDSGFIQSFNVIAAQMDNSA